jgi:hypothetical protein
MYCSIHLWNTSMDIVREILLDYSVKQQGKSPGISEKRSSRNQVIVVPEENGLVSIFPDNPNSIRNLTVEISTGTDSPVIGITIQFPCEWNMFAAQHAKLRVQYHWAVSCDAETDDGVLAEIETDRLKALGLVIPDDLKSRSTRGKTKRIRSGDPHVELHYREKMSDGNLTPQHPEMDPEIPKILSGMFPGSVAARFRNILGKPHLSVEQMAAEFTTYLQISSAFTAYSDWLESVSSESSTSGAFIFALN